MNDNTNFEFASADLPQDITEQIVEKVTIKHLTDLFQQKNNLQNDLFQTKQLLDSNSRNYEFAVTTIKETEKRMLENPFYYSNNFSELKTYETNCLHRITNMLFMEQNRISIHGIEDSLDNLDKQIEEAIAQLKGE